MSWLGMLDYLYALKKRSCSSLRNPVTVPKWIWYVSLSAILLMQTKTMFGLDWIFYISA